MLTTTSPEGAPAAQPPQQQQLGLQQPGPARVGGSGCVRKAATKPAARKGAVWGSVKILKEHDTSPQVECNFCGVKFCGGATRIKEHLCDKCTDDSPEFLALKESLLGAKGEKGKTLAVKRTHEEVAESVAAGEAKAKAKLGQQSIQSSMYAGKAEACDKAIGEFFYGLNVGASKGSHPLFKDLVEALKTAPASYQLPTRQRMLGDLLEKTTDTLKAEERPVRGEVLKFGGSIISDGWDDVNSSHLINVLIGSATTTFFEGTYQLTSADSENAEAIPPPPVLPQSPLPPPR